MLKALLCAVALVFLPSSLFAAPIVQEEDFKTVTFETTLSIAFYIEYPAFSSELGYWHSMPIVSTSWEVPMFDYALGTPLALTLYWDGTGPGSYRTVISEDPVPGPVMLFNTNYSDVRQGPDGAMGQVYPIDELPITWTISVHPDSRSYYDPSYAATFDVLLTGPATAIYAYAPAAIPEPATLLLLGSGLIGAEWKRRRRATP